MAPRPLPCRRRRPERETALKLLPQSLRGGETIVCDKGYIGSDFLETTDGESRRLVGEHSATFAASMNG